MGTATLGGAGGSAQGRPNPTVAVSDAKRSRTVRWEETGEVVDAEGDTMRVMIEDVPPSQATAGLLVPTSAGPAIAITDDEDEPTLRRPFGMKRGVRTGMSVYDRVRKEPAEARSIILSGDRAVPAGLRGEEVEHLQIKEVEERQRRETFDYKMTSALKTLRRQSIEKQPDIRRRLQDAKQAERTRRETWNRAWDKRELRLVTNRPDASDDLFRLLDEEAEREAATERARDRNASEAAAASKHGRVSVANFANLFQQAAVEAADPHSVWTDTGDHDTVFGFADTS
jgi:hypothetical protein